MIDGSRWRTDAPGKWDTATTATAVLLESERLLVAVFRRRTETVADVAVKAAHAFTLLDREARGQDAPGRVLEMVLRAPRGHRHNYCGGGLLDDRTAGHGSAVTGLPGEVSHGLFARGDLVRYSTQRRLVRNDPCWAPQSWRAPRATVGDVVARRDELKSHKSHDQA
jgi:hypothetical protein